MIYKLSFLGWTQQEIADVVGMKDQGGVSKIMKSSNFGKIHNDFEKDKSITEIAEYHGLELTTAWAIIPIENSP